MRRAMKPNRIPIAAGALLLLLPLAALAADSAQGFTDCEHLGETHGQGTHSSTIKTRCFSRFLSAAPAVSARKSDDRKLLAFGHRNLLFIETSAQGRTYRNIVAGQESQLHEIGAVALDSRNGE